MALLLYHKKLQFFGLFLLCTLASTYAVNPLYRGLSPLHNTALTEVIQTINDPQAGWAVYDSIIWGNYLASNDVRVLNGTYYVPNIDFWSRFDPHRLYINVYNRYANIVMIPNTDPKKIEFDTIRADAIQLKISPCNPLLKEVGIRFFLFPAPQVDFSCLSLIGEIKYPQSSLYIYESSY